MRFDFGQSNGAVALYVPRTGNLIVTSSERPAAPAGQHESASAGLGLRNGERLAKLRAWVVGKKLAADAQDHVAHRECAIGGRTLGDLGDFDLARIGGDKLVGKHPAAGAVAPRFQSCSNPSGMDSPLVKSGLVTLPFGFAAETLAGSASSTAATKDVSDLMVMYWFIEMGFKVCSIRIVKSVVIHLSGFTPPRLLCKHRLDFVTIAG